MAEDLTTILFCFVLFFVRERIKTGDRDILLNFYKYRYFYTKILIFV